MGTWISNHKAMLGSIAATLVAVSGLLPTPAAPFVQAAALVLAALSGGPQPARPE